MNTGKTRDFVIFSMFVAIIAVLAFTPIGFIQLGFIKATIIHVPVIIGSILLGPKKGAGLGFVFGLTSLVNNTMLPVLSSFAFSPFIPVPGTSQGSALALVVCFIPRILVGIVPWYVYTLIQKIGKKEHSVVSLAIAGVAGSLTNTMLVMHFIYFLFKNAYAEIQGIAPSAVYKFILSIIAANGLPEALIAGVLTALVCKGLITALSKAGMLKAN